MEKINKEKIKEQKTSLRKCRNIAEGQICSFSMSRMNGQEVLA